MAPLVPYTVGPASLVVVVVGYSVATAAAVVGLANYATDIPPVLTLSLFLLVVPVGAFYPSSTPRYATVAVFRH